MEIVFTVSLIALTIGFVAEGMLSVKVVLNQRKRLTKLCDENAELLATNTHLKAQLATYQHRQAKLYAEKLKKEEEQSKNAEELRDTKDKLKSAHDHISVLRAEIVKLNRQLNQRKRRG